MVARNAPEGLPSGWTEKVKVTNGRKVKFYISVETGQKFYSKKDVIRYVTTRNGCRDEFSTRSKPMKKKSENKPMRPVDENEKGNSEEKLGQNALNENERPDWLPHGWIMELRTRKASASSGKQYKNVVILQQYTDPASGFHFYSKPEVFQYLKTLEDNSDTAGSQDKLLGSVAQDNIGFLTEGKVSSKANVSQETKTGKGKDSTSEQMKIPSSKPMNDVVVDVLSPDTIPPEWIKETITRKTSQGIKKDPYYTDPVSGYVFRSKKDVFRYLETGDINKCAIRPKKKDIPDLKLINDDASTAAVNWKKLKNHSVSRCLSAGKGTRLTRSSAIPGRRQENAVLPDAMITSGPIVEVSEQKDLLDDVIGKGSASNISSVPNGQCSEGIENVTEVGKNSSLSAAPSGIFTENAIQSNQKTPVNSSKSKSRRVPSLPGRSSKRLAGLQPEMLANSGSISGLTERALRAAVRKLSAIEVNPLTMTSDAAAHRVNHQPEAGMAAVDKSAPSITRRTVKAATSNAQQSDESVLSSAPPLDNDKAKSRRMPSLPGRSSRRLAGLEPQMLANSGSISGLSERALRAAVRKLGAIEANPLPITFSAAAHRVNHQPEAAMAAVDKSAPSITQPSDKAATSNARQSDESILCSAPPLEKDKATRLYIQATLSNVQPLDKAALSSMQPLDEAAPSSMQPLDEAAPSSTQPLDEVATLDTGPSDEPALSCTRPTNAASESTQPLDMESSVQKWSSNDSERPAEDQPVLEQDMGRQEAEKLDNVRPELQDPQLINLFGGSWSDPCLEFAFKTLTGEIPVDDNLDIQNYFQQLDRSHTQGYGGLGDFTLPNIFQNDIPSSSEAPDKHMPVQQLPENHTTLPPENIALPNCSNRGPQEPS